jgi:hypothetical protein
MSNNGDAAEEGGYAVNVMEKSEPGGGDARGKDE